MALSNWATAAIDERGQPTNGVLEYEGMSVEIYKNWLYLADEKAWREGAYVANTLLEVWSGDVQYRDIHIVAERGPQEGIYCAAWAPKHKPVVILVGCGVYAFNDSIKYIDASYCGVMADSLEYLRSFITRQVPGDMLGDLTKDLPEEALEGIVPWYELPDAVVGLEKHLDAALQFNQGNMFFAKALQNESLIKAQQAKGGDV